MPTITRPWCHGKHWDEPLTNDTQEWQLSRCCDSPEVVDMDYFDEVGRPVLNRICLNCWNHWHSSANGVIWEEEYYG